ncbi:polyadenylate-binding protein 2-like [Leptinotarsa decemlineata]|uniref:polyadenylate-binding protein 2-like n=1 Tax=Leptinotarsa decemlineata TaxID=7539 RepID=UPI003D30A8B2
MANKGNIWLADEILDYELSDIKEEDHSCEDKTFDEIDIAPDPEIERMKVRVREMEEELAKLKQIQNHVGERIKMCTHPVQLSMKEKMDVDNRSIYIGNVDYGATAEELEQHFQICGPINRITITCNKYDQHPKGFAYIEFEDRESAETAVTSDESIFRARHIEVMSKRTNRPGISSTHRPPRGRGAFRGSRGMTRAFYCGNRASIRTNWSLVVQITWEWMR